MKLSEALPIKLQKISKVKPLKRKKDGGYLITGVTERFE